MMLSKGFIPLGKINELAFLINQHCINKTFAPSINPRANDIILRSDIYTKPALLIMAVSMLRYADASNLMMVCPMLPSTQNIFQTKTKRYTLISFEIIPKEIRQQIFIINKSFEVFNYVRISNSIRNYLDSNLSDYHFSFNNKTHIFRHLQATFDYGNRIPKEIICKKLGHIDNDAQKSYIHSELFNVFF